MRHGHPAAPPDRGRSNRPEVRGGEVREDVTRGRGGGGYRGGGWGDFMPTIFLSADLRSANAVRSFSCRRSSHWPALCTWRSLGSSFFWFP